jgi:hypothetical protein
MIDYKPGRDEARRCLIVSYEKLCFNALAAVVAAVVQLTELAADES